MLAKSTAKSPPPLLSAVPLQSLHLQQGEQVRGTVTLAGLWQTQGKACGVAVPEGQPPGGFPDQSPKKLKLQDGLAGEGIGISGLQKVGGKVALEDKLVLL